MDLAYFKEKLLRLRDELLDVEHAADDATQPVELDQSRVGRLSRMDALQVQAMSRESMRRRNIQIQRIDAALQRIEKGEFGLCRRCGEEIALKRLEFDSTALFCIECANKAEK